MSHVNKNFHRGDCSGLGDTLNPIVQGMYDI